MWRIDCGDRGRQFPGWLAPLWRIYRISAAATVVSLSPAAKYFRGSKNIFLQVSNIWWVLMWPLPVTPWYWKLLNEMFWILTLKNILTNHIDISIMPYVSPSCKIKIWLTSSPLRLYSNDSYTYNIRRNPFIYFVFICWEISINLMMSGFSISKIMAPSGD